MNTKLVQILSMAILVFNISSMAMYAGESSADWRSDYKSMVGAYYTGDYDEAISDARTCLDKIMRINDAAEKNVALDEVIKYLNMLGGRNGRQQNYSQQEQALKCKLKAYEAKYAGDCANDYQITRVKKDLATCLILQGKSKEAETYLTSDQKLPKTTNLSGWKKDVELLSAANRCSRSNGRMDADTLCGYATNAVDDALLVKNATEKEVAFGQITQELNTAQYRYKNDKDYPREEKILKLLLKLEEKQDTTDEFGIALGIPYSRTNTLKELVTCLVMQNKNDEAAEYNKTYHELTDKLTKDRQKYMKHLIEKATPISAGAPVIDDQSDKSANKKQ